MLPKQEDTLKRKRNILNFFKNLSEENDKTKKAKEAQRKKEEEEEERRRQADKPIRTIVVPKKKGRPSEYTAEATIHRRSHEEL